MGQTQRHPPHGHVAAEGPHRQADLVRNQHWIADTDRGYSRLGVEGLLVDCGTYEAEGFFGGELLGLLEGLSCWGFSQAICVWIANGCGEYSPRAGCAPGDWVAPRSSTPVPHPGNPIPCVELLVLPPLIVQVSCDSGFSS